MKGELQHMAQGDLFGQEVRVRVDERGEPWFVAKDVCDILGVANNRDAVSRLDADERMSVLPTALGGSQKMVAVSESGLYRLIFESRKPEARAFRRWVTHEVLPSIRKTGLYADDGVGLDEVMLRTADYLRLRGIERNANRFGQTVGDYCRAHGLAYETGRKPGQRVASLYPVSALDACAGNTAPRGALGSARRNGLRRFAWRNK